MSPVRKCVVPVDTHKHRECCLSTLKTGMCNLSTLKTGAMPEQVQKSTEPSASQVRTDSSQTNRNKVAEDSRTRDAGRLGSCGGAGVQICSYCRRKAYARVCFGIQVVLTRWQEWCVPFLSHWHLHSAASVMALVEADMMRFSRGYVCPTEGLVSYSRRLPGGKEFLQMSKARENANRV